MANKDKEKKGVPVPEVPKTDAPETPEAAPESAPEKPKKATKAAPMKGVVVLRGDKKKIYFYEGAHEDPVQAAKVYANSVKGEIIRNDFED